MYTNIMLKNIQFISFGTQIECGGQTPPKVGSGGPNPQSVSSSPHLTGSWHGTQTSLHSISQYSLIVLFLASQSTKHDKRDTK